VTATILVTGGAGFIGSNFIHYLAAHRPEWKIINLDKLTYAGNLENLREIEEGPDYRFVKGDIADRECVAPLVAESDYVVNFAAETHVDRSIHDAGDFIKTDVYGTFVLLEAFRASSRPRRFIQISTDEVYGAIETGSARETDPIAPRNPYSASKAGADRLAYSYFVTYGVPVIVTVIHWTSLWLATGSPSFGGVGPLWPTSPSVVGGAASAVPPSANKTSPTRVPTKTVRVIPVPCIFLPTSSRERELRGGVDPFTWAALNLLLSFLLPIMRGGYDPT